MDILKTTPKTNLVQSLEEIQEVNETFEVIAILKDYTNYVNCVSSNMAVPYDVLKGGGEILSCDETYLTMFPEKPTLIKIDVTKFP